MNQRGKGAVENRPDRASHFCSEQFGSWFKILSSRMVSSDLEFNRITLNPVLRMDWWRGEGRGRKQVVTFPFLFDVLQDHTIMRQDISGGKN